ncbi:MAG: hypothetical protein ACK4UV_12255, partial [Ignavibacterium sp.]
RDRASERETDRERDRGQRRQKECKEQSSNKEDATLTGNRGARQSDREMEPVVRLGEGTERRRKEEHEAR